MADPISIGLLVGSTVLSAASQIQQGNIAEQQGKIQQQQLEYQAEQAEVAAGQERALSQRRAQEERRQAGLSTSRAVALAAATGGTLDPSVINIIGDLEAEGEYGADVALYEGEVRGKDLEQQAALGRYEGTLARQAGKQQKKASRFAAATTVLKGAASGLGSKYGGAEDFSGQSSGYNPAFSAPSRKPVRYA